VDNPSLSKGIINLNKFKFNLGVDPNFSRVNLKFLGFKSQQQLDVIRDLHVKFHQNPKLPSP
jgi:hypothetical protein